MWELKLKATATESATQPFITASAARNESHEQSPNARCVGLHSDNTRDCTVQGIYSICSPIKGADIPALKAVNLISWFYVQIQPKLMFLLLASCSSLLQCGIQFLNVGHLEISTQTVSSKHPSQFTDGLPGSLALRNYYYYQLRPHLILPTKKVSQRTSLLQCNIPKPQS